MRGPKAVTRCLRQSRPPAVAVVQWTITPEQALVAPEGPVAAAEEMMPLARSGQAAMAQQTRVTKAEMVTRHQETLVLAAEAAAHRQQEPSQPQA